MVRHHPPEARVSGLLAVWAADFVAHLTGLGYSRTAVIHHVHLMAELSCWLDEHELGVEELARPDVERFRASLRARGSCLVKAASVEPLLAFLRGTGVLPGQRDDVPADAVEVLLREYERHLRVERRAGEVTIGHYLRYASEFLTILDVPSGGLVLGLPALDGARVLDAVSRQIAGHRPPSIGAVLTGDRAFLRFLEWTGRTPRSLSDAVPKGARRPSKLPARVDPATAAAILDSCDRRTEGGCRDRAVLVLLHRYGLRPVEVVRLQLGDIHWRAGEFVVHGKAGRVDVLPLVPDAGEAIVEYLRIRRAAPPDVTAVFLAARAPVQPMHKSSVGAAVQRACTRAGLARIGPRAFRHAVGHDLLQAGASLIEIRDVLRHRDVETTTGYTRVDVSALRALTRPWPGADTGRARAQEPTP